MYAHVWQLWTRGLVKVHFLGERIGKRANGGFARCVRGEACKRIEGDKGSCEDDVASWLGCAFFKSIPGRFGCGVEPGIKCCMREVHA